MVRRAILAVLALTAGLVLVPASPAAADTGEIFRYGSGPNLSHPEFITLGPDRNVWFTNFDSDQIGRITVNGTITYFHPANVDMPRGIVAGPDNRVWFTSGGTNRVFRMATNGGSVASFTNPNINNPGDITVGPDGALWFTSRGNGRIVRVTTTGTITTFTNPALDQNDLITHIVTGPDNNLWFNTFKGQSLWRLTPGGVFTEFNGTVVGVNGPSSVVVGPDDHIWFVSAFNNRIGEIDPLAGDAAAILGSIHTYVDPGAGIANPSGLTLAEDGYLWFSSRDNNKVGRLDPMSATPASTIQTYPGSPLIDEPADLTPGADGHVWFVSQANNRIGKVETVPCNTAPLPHGYTDVEGGVFFENGLNWARCHAIVAGFPDRTFHPDDPVLRGQIVSQLWVMMQMPAPGPPHGFTDVPANAFYNTPLRWAKAQQLVRGFPGHLYKPNDPVNRCQLSNMMWNMAGADPDNPPTSFTDIPNQLYCREAVEWATDHGLWDDIVTTNQFQPFAPATRSQVVDVLFELASVEPAWSAFTGTLPRTVRFN